MVLWCVVLRVVYKNTIALATVFVHTAHFDLHGVWAISEDGFASNCMAQYIKLKTNNGIRSMYRIIILVVVF